MKTYNFYYGQYFVCKIHFPKNLVDISMLTGDNLKGEGLLNTLKYLSNKHESLKDYQQAYDFCNKFHSKVFIRLEVCSK